jgi:hypothetical protein
MDIPASPCSGGQGSRTYRCELFCGLFHALDFWPKARRRSSLKHENDMGKSGGGWKGWLDISVANRGSDSDSVDSVFAARMHLI